MSPHLSTLRPEDSKMNTDCSQGSDNDHLLWSFYLQFLVFFICTHCWIDAGSVCTDVKAKNSKLIQHTHTLQSKNPV